LDFGTVELDEQSVRIWQRFVSLLADVIGDIEDWPVGVRERWPGQVHKTLGAEGFIVPRWPVAEGGLGATALVERLVNEEEQRRQLYISKTPAMLAATVRKYGTDEIRDPVVRGVAAGEIRICLGYTEPDGGSDIAAVRTRAVRDGEYWIINGTKVFTSVAHVSQYVFLLTNTDPDGRRHRNLTMFMVPLDAPGVSIEPLITVGGERTNITSYNEVRVHDKYRLGEVNQGWRVLSDPLNTEHGITESDDARLEEAHGQGTLSTTPWSVLVARALRWASTPDATGAKPFDEPVIAAGIAEVAVDLEVARNSLGPLGKVAGSTGYIRSAARILELAGAEGIVIDSGAAIESGAFAAAYTKCPPMAIAGGSVEVFRNMLATSQLNLPRALPLGG
jgi:alkylation response protein AidB-like acyl-CoA dehydrogenase